MQFLINLFFISFIINLFITLYSFYIFFDIKIFHNKQGSKLALKKKFDSWIPKKIKIGGAFDF